MRRVVVVGAPGAGKTTTARAIARQLGLIHVELDSLYWGPDWTPIPEPEFGGQLQAVVSGDSWVVDGNYFGAGAATIAWPRADTVVWLDLPRRVTARRVVRRSLTRALRRTDLWAGNRETLKLAFGREGMILFAIGGHSKFRRRYEPLADDPAYSHLTWVRLRSAAAVRRWLRALASSTPPR